MYLEEQKSKTLLGIMQSPCVQYEKGLGSECVVSPLHVAPVSSELEQPGFVDTVNA